MEQQDKRKEYKKNYQKIYYQRKKGDPEFLQKRRDISKENYKYTRKTLDCETCGIRHRADADTCLLVRDQQKNIRFRQLCDVIDGENKV